MGTKKKVSFVALLLAILVCQIMALVLIGGARILGKVAVMTKGDAEAALALAVIGLVAAVAALIVGLTARDGGSNVA